MKQILSFTVFQISIISLLCAIFPSQAGECDQWQERHPDWIWCDDFESDGDLKDRYQDYSTNGMSVSSDDVFEGEHALKQHYERGQEGAGWITRVGSHPDHVFMRWYHKFEQGFEGAPPKMARIRYRPRYGDWRAVFAVHCWIEDDIVLADVRAKNSSQCNSAFYLPKAKSEFSFDDPANIGRWICFEMEVKLNSPGSTDGLYRIWADNELIVERLNVDLRGSTDDKINELMLDCYWNGGSPKEQNRYYDNFVIATSRIGPMAEDAVSVKKKSFKIDEASGSEQPLRISIGTEFPSFSIPVSGAFTGPLCCRIYSANGTLVRELNVLAKNGRASVVWDGADSHGVKIPAGGYVLQVSGARKRIRRKLTIIN